MDNHEPTIKDVLAAISELSGLPGSVKALSTTVTEHTKILSGLSTTVAEHTKILSGLAATVSEHTRILAELSNTVSGLSKIVFGLVKDVADLSEAVADLASQTEERFVRLEARVAAIEDKMVTKDEFERRFRQFETKMVTKDYLDEKLAAQFSDVVNFVKRRVSCWRELGKRGAAA